MRLRRGLLAGALALVTLAGTGAATGMASAAPAAGGTAVAAQITTKKTASAPDFGENVVDLRPEHWTTPRSRRSSTTIQAKQVNNEMGSDRYGLYFMPGEYGSDEEPLQARSATTPRSPVWARRRATCRSTGRSRSTTSASTIRTTRSSVGCFALNNFWRGMSNLTINVNGSRPGGLLWRSANFWAVSQAVSMRRVDVNGRQPQPDGLLHRAGLRQWRLHSRLEGRCRHQRFPAAVVCAQQRGRRVDERRLEPGLLGCRRTLPASIPRTTRDPLRTRRSTRPR